MGKQFKLTPKNYSVITIERFLIQKVRYQTMAETETDKNSLPKSPTELEKVGPTFSSLFSLACACVRGNIGPLNSLGRTLNISLTVFIFLPVRGGIETRNLILNLSRYMIV